MLTLPVLPPLLEVVDIYDVAVLTPEVAANDSCYAEYEALLAVGVDTTIMEVTGADFGYAPEYVTVNMTSTVDSR